MAKHRKIEVYSIGVVELDFSYDSCSPTTLHIAATCTTCGIIDTDCSPENLMRVVVEHVESTHKKRSK